MTKAIIICFIFPVFFFPLFSQPKELNGVYHTYNIHKQPAKIGFFQKNKLIGGLTFSYDTNSILKRINIYDDGTFQEVIFDIDTLEKEKNILKKKEELSQIVITQQKDKILYEKKQKIIILFFLAGIGLILLWVVYLLYQNNRRKFKLEIQNKLIEEKQKEILDSIRYASRIQRALITSEKKVNKDLTRLKTDV